jgi:ADP-L-glycero-D-manno-heptose 6-epimerase
LPWLDDDAGAIEAVVHLGAISSTTATDEDALYQTNVRLPLAIWDWCAERGVPLIYASSAATYGDGADGFDDDPAKIETLKPLNLYGRSKQEFDLEIMARVAAGAPAPPHWSGLKFFNAYGPNEYHKGAQQSVVPQLYRQITETGTAWLFKSHNPDYEDGGQKRDFIWVGDCVDVMLWLLECKAGNGIYNCGTGAARTFKDLALAVFAAMGREPNIEYIPTPEAIRDKYQYFTEARMDRLRAAGYRRPITTLEDGVGRYVRDHLATDDPFV